MDPNEADGYGTPDGEEIELSPAESTDKLSPYRLVNGNLRASTPRLLSNTRQIGSGLTRRLATMSINPPRCVAIFSSSRPLPARTSVGVSAIFSILIAFSAEATSAELSRGTETEINPFSSEVATTAPNCIGALARGVSSILTIALRTTAGPAVGVIVALGVIVGDGVIVGVVVGVCVASGVAVAELV